MVQPKIRKARAARKTVRAFAAAKGVKVTRLLMQVKARAAPRDINARR